ncbi:CBS domain-containing protein [soil metagenome]
MAASAAPGSGGAFGSRWTLATVRGVPLYVGPSLLLLIGLFTFWIARAFTVHPAFAAGPVGAWIAAAVTTVAFIACIFAHEVGHAVTSLDRGVEVRGITLFLLGGVTESVGEPRRAVDEVVIVGIGPLISLLIAAVFGLAVRILPDFTVLELIAGYLAWLNGAMAIFNLVPGYPLDGGRLLRALLWMVTGSRHRATRMAARVGQVFAAMLLLGAVLSFTRIPVFEPRSVWIAVRVLASMGLWGGLIGFFLLRSSSGAHALARRRELLGRRTVRDLMGTVPPTVPADLQLSDVVVRLQTRPSVLWPVGRPLIGGVTLEGLDGVPRDQWSATTVDAVAEPDVFVADDTPMDEAVDLLVRARDRMLIAVRDGEPVGLLTPSLVADVST